MSNEAFFHWNPELLRFPNWNHSVRHLLHLNTYNLCPYWIFGLGQTNWTNKFWGIWSIFDQTISESLVHVFRYSTIISTKKLSLYIHIPNIYLGLGFEFGPKRIRDLYLVHLIGTTNTNLEFLQQNICLLTFWAFLQV